MHLITWKDILIIASIITTSRSLTLLCRILKFIVRLTLDIGKLPAMYVDWDVMTSLVPITADLYAFS